MKKTLCTFLVVILCLSAFSPFAFAAEISSVNDDLITDGVCNGIDISLDNIVVNPELGIVIITEASNNVHIVARMDSDQRASKTFSHKVYDRNGALMATCYSTVTGTYSQADHLSQIDSITVTFNGDFASSFSYDTSTSGNLGYLNIYFNNIYLNKFNSKIATNGYISNI